MAERRMFAKTIIDSDAFLIMSQSTQNLYFHLSMRADDDGFINNPLSIMKTISCNQGDLTTLMEKKFIIPFDSGVVVIKHWKIHNYIKSDRYKETKYKTEKAKLVLDENGAYRLPGTGDLVPCIQNVSRMYPECIQNVSKMDTQVRLGKVSLELGKDKLKDPIYDEESFETLDQAFLRISQKTITNPLTEDDLKVIRQYEKSKQAPVKDGWERIK